MRASVAWLREFVDIDLQVEHLVERLTFSGTKVEAVHQPGRAVKGVVVAEVLTIADHPNADNLILVDVVAGDGERHVVCGARNFKVGDRVPYAQVGARLPDLEISERKIRGEPSQGMLCSAAELGVSKDHSGILVLPPDAPVGDDVVALLGLDDSILELEITPNRPDCMGILGLAREIAALEGGTLEVPEPVVDASDGPDPGLDVDIVDPDGCPRYVARYIDGISPGPSPLWIANRLLGAGIRPISNVVDATNYVLLETGHPLHAFDAGKVRDRNIVVRRARTGERLTTLDGVDRTLHADDLVIADRGRPLALAGIMGGRESEVDDITTDVILEAAAFDHASISFTSRRHLIRTEASARFERKADIEMPPYAAARCVELIRELAAGRVSSAVVDAYPKPYERPRIELRPARTARILGIPVAADDQTRRLSALGLIVAEVDDRIVVEVPGFRRDLAREIDLVEEIGRFAGFDRLPATLPPGVKGGLEADQVAERTIRRVLAGFGLNEAWTPSFMGPGELDALQLPSTHSARDLVTLSNPTTEDRPGVRTTLVSGLLRSAARNFAHRADGVALFEIARVFEPSAEELPREGSVLTAVLAGQRRLKTWTASASAWDFFSAKGILEALFAALRLESPSLAPTSGMPFHPTRAAAVELGDARLGAIGELHPDVCDAFDVPEGTLAFEVALGPILAALPPRPVVEELPRYPEVFFDLAVVVDDAVPAADLERAITAAGRPEVYSVRLFDLYIGDQIPAGKKSLAYALKMRDPERTLTDEDAARVRDRITTELKARFDASLRA